MILKNQELNMQGNRLYDVEGLTLDKFDLQKMMKRIYCLLVKLPLINFPFLNNIIKY